MVDSNRWYHEIMQLRTKSGNAKLELLKTFPDLKPVLKHAYDPFTRFHIKNLPVAGAGMNGLTEETAVLLRMLSDQEVTGYAALDLVTLHTRQMTSRSAEVFKLILNKDLKIGMGAKSINKVFPGLIPTHDIMLAQSYFKKPEKAVFPCFASDKIDGVRAVYRHGKFLSRGGHEYKGLDHLHYALRNNVDREFDGELYIPGKTFQTACGEIRSHEKTPDAVYAMFDLPSCVSTFTDRYVTLLEYNSRLTPVILHNVVLSVNEAMILYAKARKAGLEGLMLKTPNHLYQGKRSYDWLKMKNIETDDFRVIDIYPGVAGKKYEHCMGGVTVARNSVETNIGGGWSDQQRKDYWQDPSLIIGKWIEVSYHELTPDRKLREPRVIRLRPDMDD